jgi:hypothetical protein
MNDFTFGKSRKSLKNASDMHKAHKHFLDEKEEHRRLETQPFEADSVSIIGDRASYKQAQRQKSLATVNKRSADIYAERLANSLGLVVSSSVSFTSNNEEAQKEILVGVSSIIKDMLQSGKISIKELALESAPHTVEYLSNIRRLAEHQAKVEANEEPEDEELSSEIQKSIMQYESSLSEVVADKLRLVMISEKKLEEKITNDRLYAQENAMDPVLYMKKKAKENTSFFRKIVEAHVEGELKKGHTDIDNKLVFAEALVSYSLLETLHTSKIATRADLSFIK